MSAPTTSTAFSGSTPAAASGYQNAKPQSDGGTPEQIISFELPNEGGVATKTASYTPTTAQAVADCGVWLVFNSSSAVTYTLPATPPNVPDGGGTNRWRVRVTNIGSGALTVAVASGPTLDGGTSSISLAQYTGISIATDGTNYFTQRGTAPDLSSYATKAGVQKESYTAADDTGSANAYAVALSPAPTVVKYSEVVFKAANANTGASTLAVNGGTAIAIQRNDGTALQAGDIPAGGIITVRYDGSFWKMANGTSGGGTGSLYFGSGTNTVTVSGTNTVVLPSTPVTGSVQLFLNGVECPSNTLTISGTNVAYDRGWAVGDVISCAWATTNSTPGTSISFGSPSATPLVIRGTGILHAFAITFTINWPSGTQAGDLAVIAVGGQGLAGTPTGWTSLDSSGGTTFVGATFAKTLTSGDITAGGVSITMTPSGAAGDLCAGIITYVGSGAIRETHGFRGTSSPVTLTTTSAVAATDTIFYFGSNWATDVVTVNRGIQQQTVTAAASGTIYTENPGVGGALSATFNYTTSTNCYQSLVVIEGATPAASASPLVTESQVINLTSDLAAKVTNPMTTTGDLIVGGASGAPARVAAGTAGQVLTMVSGSPAWAAAGTGSGGWVLLEAHTASSSTELDFTSSFSSLYDVYAIQIVSLLAGTSGASLLMQFSTNSGVSWDTAAHYDYGSGNTQMITGTAGSNAAGAATSINIFGTGVATNEPPSLSAELRVWDPLNASDYTYVTGDGLAKYSGNNTRYLFRLGGVYWQFNSVNAVRFLMSSGTIASGTIRIYGIAH